LVVVGDEVLAVELVFFFVVEVAEAEAVRRAGQAASASAVRRWAIGGGGGKGEGWHGRELPVGGHGVRVRGRKRFEHLADDEVGRQLGALQLDVRRRVTPRRAAPSLQLPELLPRKKRDTRSLCVF